MVGGFAIVQARSLDEAVELATRFGAVRRRSSVCRSAGSRTGSTDELDAVVDDDGVGDDLLGMILMTYHPVLSPEARVALTLRILGGLKTDEIARAFLLPEPTVAQRIVRAKRTLAAAQIPFEIPGRAELQDRLETVLEVVLLIFNGGYSATSGDDWMRPALCEDAPRLGRILAHLVPTEAEVHGLVALMEIQASRTAARTSADGAPVLLLDQDRTRWHQLLIRRGLAALERAEALGGPFGLYVIQAEIAACHARAPTAEETDWIHIAALHDALAQVMPSPVVQLNRAVAVGHAFGPAAGLEITTSLLTDPALERYHLLPSVHGDLLARLGRYTEAHAASSGRHRSPATSANGRCSPAGRSRPGKTSDACRNRLLPIGNSSVPNQGTRLPPKGTDMALTTAYQPAHDTAADTSTTSPVQRAATTATASAGGFVALLAVLHLLKPELDPSWRMVSEYEIGRHGWVMRLAFGCLAVACVSLHAALRGKVHGIAGRVGRAGLLAGAAGTALVGAFASDPITATKDQLTMQGNLHGLGFTMGVPGMLLAVGLVTRAVRRSQPTSAGAVRWFAPRLGQPCRLPRHHGRHLRRHVRARRPGRLAQPAARGQLRRLDHLHRPCGPPRRALLRSHRHDYPQDQRERCRGIDAYLTSLPERLGDVAAARAAIDTALPEAHATIWHGQPVWSRGADTGRNPICLLKAYTSHVTLGLWQGQAVDDPTGRLEPGSRDMASVKMRSVEDVDPDAIASWLQQAWRLYE